jgi:hypothetical protein
MARFFGLGHGLQRQAGKEQFLIGAGIEFLGHFGDLPRLQGDCLQFIIIGAATSPA